MGNLRWLRTSDVVLTAHFQKAARYPRSTASHDRDARDGGCAGDGAVWQARGFKEERFCPIILAARLPGAFFCVFSENHASGSATPSRAKDMGGEGLPCSSLRAPNP